MDAILICYYPFEIFELYHNFKEHIGCCMFLFYPVFCSQDINLTLSLLSSYSSTNLHNSDQ